MQTNPPQNRDGTGRFLAGQSGNPGGRPVAFHNYIQERTGDGSELTDFVLKACSVERTVQAPKNAWTLLRGLQTVASGSRQ